MNAPTSVLLVDDDMPFRQVMAGELRRLGFAVETAASGEEGLRRIAECEPHVVLLDLRLPGLDGLEVLRRLQQEKRCPEVIMLTGHGSIDTAIESIRIGAFDYVVKPCPLDEIELRIQRAVERRALRQRANLLERGLTPPDLAGSFVGDSVEFRGLLHLIERVAPTDSTVLIEGETGSGKERVAKMIHARSSRRDSPFVVVDCAALQESLLQSELFGHQRGAFTGADKAKPGLFEVAHRGTIFLDEIGEISHATQVSLLRVLDTSTFRHVGGTAEVQVDVRVIAATNRDLPAMVRQAAFREDLYYRLSTVTVEVPPLRERAGDVDMLALYFLNALNRRFSSNRKISPPALRMLHAHHWPGNVRELRHAIESAMIVCDGPEILPEHLPAAIRRAVSEKPAAGLHHRPPLTLADLERTHIQSVLRSAGGHRGKAAKILGISERNLYRKLREYGLLTHISAF